MDSVSWISKGRQPVWATWYEQILKMVRNFRAPVMACRDLICAGSSTTPLPFFLPFFFFPSACARDQCMSCYQIGRNGFDTEARRTAKAKDILCCSMLKPQLST